MRPRPDILAVIERHVQLRRCGRERVGLCPFHTDKTPSLSVSAEKGLWFCHGCGAGGDAIDFIRRAERCTYQRALQILGVADESKPRPALTAGRLRSAEQALAWAELQRERLNQLIGDRYEQRDLADEIGDFELAEIFDRELILLRAFYDALNHPSGVIEMLGVRDAIERLTA